MLTFLCIAICCIHKASSLSSSPSTKPLSKAFTGVRFSLYPNMNKEDNRTSTSSLKEAIKYAVKPISSLGVEVRPNDVSSCLLGSQPTLFEAVRVAFGHAARTTGGKPRNVSTQCAFSAGCPGEDVDTLPLPSQTVEEKEGVFVSDALDLPPHVAYQFAIYPLGTVSHMDTIYSMIEYAKQRNCWKEGKSHVCSMLDGDGVDVFDTIQSCFQLTREACPDGHVVMTATLTVNLSRWPEEDKSSSPAAAASAES
eukprot:4673002-Ditylum_brightwellii.AAC.1